VFVYVFCPSCFFGVVAAAEVDGVPVGRGKVLRGCVAECLLDHSDCRLFHFIQWKHSVHRREVVGEDVLGGAEGFKGFIHVADNPDLFRSALSNQFLVFEDEKIDDCVEVIREIAADFAKRGAGR